MERNDDKSGVMFDIRIIDSISLKLLFSFTCRLLFCNLYLFCKPAYWGYTFTGLTMGVGIFEVLTSLYHDYRSSTPQKLKIIDAYLVYIMITGIVQFVYCCMVGTFPFNSFLSGFISCIASFILAVCLRLQVNPQNKSEFNGINSERAFSDFIFAHVILHLVVMNFMG